MDLLKRLWLLAVGVTAIAAGYVLLAGSQLTIGPILLVAGYCVALPVFVWQQFRQGGGE